MKRLTKRSSWLLVFVFSATALIMTSYESLKELLFKGTLTTWESHTITIIVTSSIATLTASFIRTWLISIHAKEKEIEEKHKILESFQLILSAVNHIVNNVLNYLQLVKVDFDMHGKVNEDTLKLLEFSIQEAAKQMKILNQIQDPDDPSSYSEIYPHKDEPK